MRTRPLALRPSGPTARDRPLVSVVVPAFNEAASVHAHLERLHQHLRTLEPRYRWEVLVVNDGSTDDTGRLAERFAASFANIRVLHHRRNFGLGQALRFAFRRSRGDYVVTLDMDLSYSPDHIAAMIDRLRETSAKVVIASPYMAGGSVKNVPWLRRTLSRCANRFLARAAGGRLSTLTGMVRAYDGPFLRSLTLRSMGMEVNPEIIHKALLLNARIEEVPGRLEWPDERRNGHGRGSSARLVRHTMAVLLSGFLFRPVVWFLLPGLVLLAFSTYVNVWMLIHFFTHYGRLGEHAWVLDRASAAVAAAYVQAPHTFIVGGLTAMLAIQLISLGILALQSKGYFEEIFHLGSATYRAARERTGSRR